VHSLSIILIFSLCFYAISTFVCPTEIIAFNDRLSEFEELGATVIGISVDSEHTHLAWTRTPRTQGGVGPLSIPLLSDLDKSISQKFGVLLENGISLRASFIMDPIGVVRQATINDLPIGRSVDEILRLIQAIQYFDHNGEVCPANWTPGKKTIIPNHNEAKKYFESLNPT
jgi:alkyl hydroperoxide reductase subunit AhpC